MIVASHSLGGPAHGALPQQLGRALLVVLLCAAPLSMWAVAGWQRPGLTAALCAMGSFACFTHLRRGTSPLLLPGSIPLCLLLLGGLLCSLPLAGAWAIPDRGLAGSGEALGMLVAFLAAGRLFAPARHLGLLCALCGSLALVLGLQFLGDPQLAWDPAPGTNVLRPVFGSQLSRNHLAAFCCLASLVATGCLLARRHCANRRAGAYLPGQWAWLGVAMAAALVVFSCASRAAAACLCGGLTLMLWLHREGLPTLRPYQLLLGLGLAAVLLSWSDGTILARVQTLPDDLVSDHGRLGIWRSTLDLWLQAPLLGTGAGSLSELIAPVQEPAVAGQIHHAHCDPLELLCERGVIGLNLGLAALLLGGRPLWRPCQRLRGDRRRLQGAGIGIALLCLLAHSCVDLPLQIPGLLLWASCLAGAACGALPPPPTGQHRTLPKMLLPPALLLCCAGSIDAGLRCGAELCATDPGRGPQQALAIHASDGRHHFAAARQLCRAAAADFDAVQVVALSRAGLRRNPFSATGHLLLARGMTGLPGARILTQWRTALRLVPPRQRLGLAFDLAIWAQQLGRDELLSRWFAEQARQLGPRAGRLVELARDRHAGELRAYFPKGLQ